MSNNIPTNLKICSFVYDEPHSERRFQIVNEDTGEVVDNAQGYGFKTAQKAYRFLAWKFGKKQKDKDWEKKMVQAYIKQNPGLEEELVELTLRGIKEGQQITEEDIVELLEDLGVEKPKFKNLILLLKYTPTYI